MAFSPFRPPPGMVLSSRHISRYRRRLNTSKAAQSLASSRLSPPLVRITEEDSQPLSLDALLAESPRLRIISPTSPARTSLLSRLCLHWAREELEAEIAVPLLLMLPELPADPEQALAATIAQAGFPAETLVVRRGLAAGQWLLLLDSWDALEPSSQEVWAAWLSQLAYSYPALSLVITTGPSPIASQDWPDLVCAEVVEASATPANGSASQ